MGRWVVEDASGQRWFLLGFEDVAEILQHTHAIADLHGRREQWLAEVYPGYSMPGLLAAIEAEGGLLNADHPRYLSGRVPSLKIFEDGGTIRIKAPWPWSKVLEPGLL